MQEHAVEHAWMQGCRHLCLRSDLLD